MSILFKSAIGITKGTLGRNVPLKVEHIITYKCNFRCSYCNLWNEKTKELSTDQIKLLMDKFSKMGTVSWNFTGGEPLLRDDMKELVDYAKLKRFYITLNSNGILVKKNIGWLKNVDLIGISLDGPDYIHNKTRGKFAEVIEAVKLLIENKANIYICSVMSKNSLKEDCKGLRDTLKLAEDLNVRIAVLPLFEDKLSKGKIDDLIPTREEFKMGVEVLKEFKRRNNRLLLISWPTLDYFEKGLPPIKCKAGKYYCSIWPDGKVSQCMFMEKQNSIKNLKPVGKVDCNLDGFHCQLCYLEYNNIFSLKLNTLYIFLRNYFE